MAQVFLPGETITLPSSSNSDPKVGKGITKKKNGELVSVQPGILQQADDMIFMNVYSRR